MIESFNNISEKRIPSGKYYIVYCDDENSEDLGLITGPHVGPALLSTPFKLSISDNRPELFTHLLEVGVELDEEQGETLDFS